MTLLKNLLRRHFSQIIFVAAAGGVGLLFQVGIFELLAIYLKVLSPSTATVLGAEVGIIVNFIINDRITFRNRLKTFSLPHRFVRHQVVVLGAVFLQWLLVFVTEHMTSNIVALHIAFAAGIGLGFIWNYSWYHLYVWRHRENN